MAGPAATPLPPPGPNIFEVLARKRAAARQKSVYPAAGHRYPAYLLPLTILTGVYLSFELAFNARLLDVAGGLANHDEIDSIEHCGRFISGIAFVLGIWGMRLMPLGVKKKWSVQKWVLFLSVSGILGVVFVYNAEKALIDWRTDRSSGEERRIAAQLTLLSHAILKQQILVKGIDLSGSELNTPEGKSFIALFPVLAFSTNDLDTKADKVMRQVIKANMLAETGPPEDAYNKGYLPSLKRMHEGYNKYVDGEIELTNALDQIPARQQEAWEKYEAGLRKRRMTPNMVPPIYYRKVRDEIRHDGVPVPDDWIPSDRQGFDDVVRQKIEGEANQRYRAAMEQQFGRGEVLPLGLSFQMFLDEPPIQRKWRDALGIADSPVRLRSGMTVQEFAAVAFTPQVDKKVDEIAARYEADASTFEDGGENATLGKDAMNAVLVPPTALGFSLVGGMVHIAKFSLCLAAFVSRRKVVNRFMVIGTLAVLALSAFFVPNEITRSRVYADFQRRTMAQVGWLAERPLTWVVQAQPFFYPANEWVRTHVLSGVTFGYHPGTHLSSVGEVGDRR